MTDEEIILYRARLDAAVLAVARRVASAFGIKDVDNKSWEVLQCLMIDKREAWQEGGQRADAQFETKLLERHAYFGKQTPYHNAFDKAFRNQLSQLPLREVEPYIKSLCTAHETLQDPIGYGYLADILRDPVTVKSAKISRALRLLERNKSRIAQRTSTRGKRIVVLENPCLPKLTLELADEIATAVGLIQYGQYILRPRKKCALVGFHQALFTAGLVTGTIDSLNDFFGQRYGVEVKIKNYKQKAAGRDWLELTAAQITARHLRPTYSDKL